MAKYRVMFSQYMINTYRALLHRLYEGFLIEIDDLVSDFGEAVVRPTTTLFQSLKL